MKPWLEILLEQTQELESPQSFWLWSALASVAAVVKDNVYLDRGGGMVDGIYQKGAFKQYPNIYVMLLARSGLRKGPPINLAKQLVRKVNNTRIINGRSSIQAILKEMGTAHTVPGGKISAKSDAFIIASEFTSSIVEDKAAMTILTDLYDRLYNEGEYKSLLKMETFQLKDPVVNMLVGTNEPHFRDFLSDKDVHGGFIGRMFVIAESKKHVSNSLIKPLKHSLDIEKLVPHLIAVSKLSGKFADLYETDAGEIYEKWYTELDEVINHVEDKTGTLERIGEAVLKVAMLLSLSERTDLIISSDNMERAIALCERLVGNIRKTTLSQGSKQSFAEQKVLIIEELLKRENHMVSRAQMLKKYWMHFNFDQLDMIMQSFDQSGMITTESQGNQIIYKMNGNQVEQLTKFLEGKN